jgi:hypothetical protein
MDNRGLDTKQMEKYAEPIEELFDNYRNPFLPPDQNEYAQKNGINLSGINFSGINFSGINFSGINFSGINLKGVQLDHNVNGLLEKPVNLPNNGKNGREIV